MPVAPQGKYDEEIELPLDRGKKHYAILPLTDRSQFVSGEVSAGMLSSVDLRASDISGLYRFSRKIKIDLRHALKTLADKKMVYVTVKLKVIDSWEVGWAYRVFPVIYLNMRDPSTNELSSAKRAKALLIHEIGHKLHLTSDGSRLPDKQKHHYPDFDAQGVKHTGNHCSTGVPEGMELWKTDAKKAATCNMWGSLTGNDNYCDECKTTLRKIDLSKGF